MTTLETIMQHILLMMSPASVHTAHNKCSVALQRALHGVEYKTEYELRIEIGTDGERCVVTLHMKFIRVHCIYNNMG